jgi:hypothetical protein
MTTGPVRQACSGLQATWWAIGLMLVIGCDGLTGTTSATREYRGDRNGKSASICFSPSGKWAMINNGEDFDNDARMGDYIELADRFVISGGSQGEAAVVRKEGEAIRMRYGGKEVLLQLVK